MSILDTFYILFKTDADKATDDVKKLDDASDKTEGTLKRLDRAATGVGSSFVNMARNLAAPILAMASLTGAIAIVSNRIAEIDTINDDAFKLRSTPQDYDAFTRAVRAAGGEMVVAQANLTAFGEKMNDAAARAAGPNAKNFAKWGIAFRDANGEAVGAVDGILALAASLETVSRAEALGRLKRLGINDADTIDFLLQGKKAIVEKMEAEKEAGVVTDEQIRLAGEFQAATGKTRNTLDSLAGALTELVLPAVISAYNAFNRLTDWMSRNKTLVSGFFIGIAGVITAVFLPALTAMAAAVVAATWPFLAIGAAIAAVGVAFALAYEDVVAFMNGQPSLIGALAERYEWFGKIVNGIVNIFPTLRDAATSAINGIKSASDAFFASTGWTEFSEGLSRDMQTVMDALRPVVEMFREMWGVIESFAADSWSDFVTDMTQLFSKLTAALQPVVAAFQSAKQAIMDFFGAASSNPASAYGGGNVPPGKVAPLSMGGMTFPSGVAAGQSALNNASGAPINGQTQQSIAGAPTVNQNSNVSVGSVTVNTQATDAKGVAAAVKGELTKQLRNTSAQFDDGVAK